MRSLPGEGTSVLEGVDLRLGTWWGEGWRSGRTLGRPLAGRRLGAGATEPTQIRGDPHPPLFTPPPPDHPRPQIGPLPARPGRDRLRLRKSTGTSTSSRPTTPLPSLSPPPRPSSPSLSRAPTSHSLPPPYYHVCSRAGSYQQFRRGDHAGGREAADGRCARGCLRESLVPGRTVDSPAFQVVQSLVSTGHQPGKPPMVSTKKATASSSFCHRPARD